MPAQATKMVRTPVSEPTPEAPTTVPERDEVAAVAYSLWQARGCPDGSPDEDWYRAEAELRERREAAR